MKTNDPAKLRAAAVREYEKAPILNRVSVIVAECKRRVPNPEHGPGQYAVVIKYLRDEEQNDVRKLPLRDAVRNVLEFMNEG